MHDRRAADSLRVRCAVPRRGRGRFRRPLGLLALLALTGLGCAGSPGWECRDWGGGRRCSRPLPTPPGAGWTCDVVGGTLACARPTWGPGAVGWSCGHAGPVTVCRAPRAAEPPEPAPDGWQGFVAERRIVMLWRRAGNDPWACAGDACTERHPDRPGADEWECVDQDGRVLCRSRFLRGVDSRWHCAPQGERFLCLDLDPDYPGPGRAAGWKCYYDDSLRSGRVCTRAVPRPCALCPGICIGDGCWPTRTTPECYFDGDCTDGRACRVGLCVVR